MDQNSTKKISYKEIANLSDAEFKTLVIRMLTELIEYGRQIEEKVKAMKSETKKNLQGTNSKRRRPGFESMIWNIRKK